MPAILNPGAEPLFLPYWTGNGKLLQTRFPVSTGGRYLYNDKRDVADYQIAVVDYGNFVMTLQAGEFTRYLDKTTPGHRKEQFIEVPL